MCIFTFESQTKLIRDLSRHTFLMQLWLVNYNIGICSGASQQIVSTLKCEKEDGILQLAA